MFLHSSQQTFTSELGMINWALNSLALCQKIEKKNKFRPFPHILWPELD